MNVLIVLAHPEPRSFNAHLAHHARDVLTQHGHTVELSDLYAANFNPREAAHHFEIRCDPACFDAAAEQRYSWERQSLPADVRSEIDKILRADLAILQFPLMVVRPTGDPQGLDRSCVRLRDLAIGALHEASAVPARAA